MAEQNAQERAQARLALEGNPVFTDLRAERDRLREERDKLRKERDRLKEMVSDLLGCLALRPEAVVTITRANEMLRGESNG